MTEIQINKEQFAFSVINSTEIDISGLTDEEIAKKKLTLFLSSYFLADKFNCLEKKDLRDADKINEMIANIKFTQ